MKKLKYHDLNFDVNTAVDEMFRSFDQVIYVDINNDIVADLKNANTLLNFDYESMNSDEFFRYVRNNLIFESDREVFDNVQIAGKLNAELGVKWSDGIFRKCYCKTVRISANEFIYMLLDLTEYSNECENIKTKYLEVENIQRMQYRKNSHKYRLIIEQTNIVLYEWYAETNSVIFSDNARRHFRGYYDSDFSLDEIFNSGVVYKEDIDFLKKCLDDIYKGILKDKDIKVRLINLDGKYIWYNITISPVLDENGKLIMAVGTILDVNKATNYLIKLKYRAEIDDLTRLSNPYKFTEDMNRLMKNDNKNYAMIVLDIEKFKAINEIYGIEFADNLLRYIAHTLKSLVRQEDLTGRFSGDCFGIFVEYNSDEQIVSLIERICKCVSFYKGAALTVVFGVYRVLDNKIPRRKILDYANMAKSTVKGKNLKRFAFYEDSMLLKMLEEQHIENDMDQALYNGQFTMFLQPRYDIQTSEIIGAEALVRWMHPDRGIMMPNKFIGLFEKNGFVVKLDRYMWEQACIQIRKWMDDGLRPVPISVNVSRINVENPQLTEIFDGLVEKYQIDKKYLELEITETVYYDNQDVFLDTLEKLKNSGYTLLMDDFGSGFSSLNMLKNTPFDILKIDRNFLDETIITDKGKKIIDHTIKLSNDIGIEIVAEGVETKEQAEYLLQCGCNTAQGYYYSKPVSLDEFERLFNTG